MKGFMLLHVGCEIPTAQVMDAWTQWFDDACACACACACAVEHGGLRNGQMLSAQSQRPLAFDAQAITGFSIIRAENIEAATEIAQRNPYVTAVQVYEIAQYSN